MVGRALPLRADWHAAGPPVGTVTIRRDALPGVVALVLDAGAAAELGDAGHVRVTLAGRVLTLEPAPAGDAGARQTWTPRGGAGALAVTARITMRRGALGRWPCWRHGAGLVVDLAGDVHSRAA